MRGKLEALYPLACGILAAFAFAFNWATGHRGVFLFDQSQIFDGGWRILQGQTPYQDFLFPYGPVTFSIQALFFFESLASTGRRWSCRRACSTQWQP